MKKKRKKNSQCPSYDEDRFFLDTASTYKIEEKLLDQKYTNRKRNLIRRRPLYQLCNELSPLVSLISPHPCLGFRNQIHLPSPLWSPHGPGSPGPDHWWSETLISTGQAEGRCQFLFIRCRALCILNVSVYYWIPIFRWKNFIVLQLIFPWYSTLQ